MEDDEFRFSLSTDKYLERHNVLVYMRDVVSQLLEHRDENSKINTSKFFSDYFISVKEGNHVLFREFNYIKATPHNRASFVRMFWKCFKHIGRKGDLLSISEYHALVCLLCADFPFEPIQKTARIILMEDALDSLISFSDFLFAFQTQFCFDDFLVKCADAYQILLDAPQSPHTTVVVPTSDTSVTKAHPSRSHATNTDATMNNNSNSDGVDSMLFYRALVPISEKLDLQAPPNAVLKEILLSVKRVTFFGFLISLAKSETLNTAIGKLPPKAELFEISEQENASPTSSPLASRNYYNQRKYMSRPFYRCPTVITLPLIRPTSGTKSRPRSAQSSNNNTPGGGAGSSSTQSSTEVGSVPDQKAANPGSGKSSHRSSQQQNLTTITNTTTISTSTPTVNLTTISSPNIPVTGTASSSVNGMVTSSLKSLPERSKPPPRRPRRNVAISDDDDDDDDDDDGDDSGSDTN